MKHPSLLHPCISALPLSEVQSFHRVRPIAGKSWRLPVLIAVAIAGIMLLFWPAAAISSYVPFLLALFVVGCGSATPETAANPFIAQFDPAETGPVD